MLSSKPNYKNISLKLANSHFLQYLLQALQTEGLGLFYRQSFHSDWSDWNGLFLLK